jgi:hypothetical protein
MMRYPIAVLCLGLLASPGIAQSAKDAKPKPDPRIKVTLRFSVDELDPLKPGDSFIECRVHNGSDKPIQVPTVYIGGYTDRDMRLGGGRVELIYWAGGKERQKFVELDPGKDIVVFKERLGILLLLDPKEIKPLKPAEPRYYWSWNL